MESDWNQSLSFMEIKMNIQKKIAEELKIKEWQVESVIKLIDEGNTIPFIARYRKEAHGSLDDEQLRNLSERLTYLRNLEEKKQQVLASIEEQGKLTEELKNRFWKHRHRLLWMICIVRTARREEREQQSPKRRGLMVLHRSLWHRRQ